MVMVSWKESYCVGDATIDSQHEYLFALANAMVESSDKEALTRNAMKLFSYTREHFGHEEALMRKIGYPGYSEHLALHEGLITRLSAISSSIYKDLWSASDMQAFMQQWVLHILDVDRRLAGFMQCDAPLSQQA